MLLKKLYLIFACIILLPACKKISLSYTTYADTNIIHNGFKKNKTFIVDHITISEDTKQKNLLQTKELTKKIELILQDNGYNTTQNINKADYYLVFDYGIKSKTESKETYKYVPGQIITGVNNKPKPNNINLPLANKVYEPTDIHTIESGSYVPVIEEHTFYKKYLYCYVYDAKEYIKSYSINEKPEQIWYGSIWNFDENCDLREYLDFLVVQLFNVFGKNSQKTIVTELSADDKSISKLRSTYYGS